MPNSETKVITGGLAHIPVLIFISNFIENKFEARAQSTSISKCICLIFMFSYLAFFKYRFFLLARSNVNNITNIVPTKNENIVVTSKTVTISLGR